MEAPPEATDLQRFIDAQQGVYQRALAELKGGQKQTHWMWFIFPQLAGLGFSETSRFYAIHDLDEARRYLAHPLLGARLRECCIAILGVEGWTAHQIFGSPDDQKLRSSMTLFAAAAEDASLFEEILRKYYGGQSDRRTLDLLKG